MNDEPINLSLLDPTRKPRFNAMAGAIARDAMAARAARPSSGADMLGSIAAWMRPALLAAGIVLAIAIPALARLRAPRVPVERVSAMEVLGIPRELTDLLRSSQTPTLAELHDALATTSGR